MKTDKSNKDEISDSDEPALIWAIISVITMILCAAFYFTYPFPGGKPTISNFILIYFREIIIAGICVITFIYLLVKKIQKFLNL